MEQSKDIKSLAQSIDHLVYTTANQTDNKPGKAFYISLIKGIAFGFGSVLGATLIVAIFVYVLSKIQLVPVIGDFVKNLLNYMKEAGVKGISM